MCPPSSWPNRLKTPAKPLQQAAAALEFEQAAELRNRLHALEQQSLGLSAPTGKGDRDNNQNPKDTTIPFGTPEVTQTANRRSAKKTGRRARRARAKTAKGER